MNYMTKQFVQESCDVVAVRAIRVGLDSMTFISYPNFSTALKDFSTKQFVQMSYDV